jgi:hypothetical protein
MWPGFGCRLRLESEIPIKTLPPEEPSAGSRKPAIATYPDTRLTKRVPADNHKQSLANDSLRSCAFWDS